MKIFKTGASGYIRDSPAHKLKSFYHDVFMVEVMKIIRLAEKEFAPNVWINSPGKIQVANRVFINFLIHFYHLLKKHTIYQQKSPGKLLLLSALMHAFYLYRNVCSNKAIEKLK